MSTHGVHELTHRALGLYIVYMIVFAGFGAGSGLGLFLHTSPGLQVGDALVGEEVMSVYAQPLVCKCDVLVLDPSLGLQVIDGPGLP